MHRFKSATALPGLLSTILLALPAVANDEGPSPAEQLVDIHRRAGELRLETWSAEEHRQVAAGLRELLAELSQVERDELDFDGHLDHDLLRSQLEIRRFEIEDAQVWQQVPVRYLRLGRTSSLLLRPCSAGSEAVASAIEELEKLPALLEQSRENLTNPARTWTENAIYTAWYAEQLLAEELPAGCIEATNRDELLEATRPALDAVRSWRDWMQSDLLPRSTRSAAWDPALIETYHRVQEWLPEPSVEGILAIAREEERATRRDMEELAKRIHPSGDLKTVWKLMGDEAPPWPEVLPMAQRYVQMTADWLAGDGAHLLEIPERFDYGTVISTPMARRVLSFGGASYGPTLGGRISGYYVITPLESRLSEEEKASRIRSYNPYWTHVISYHEWVGHNVQRAWAITGAREDRPSAIRRSYGSAYLSQAWSFYLEKLFEDHGYFDVLPHMEALKTRMARLQMRMWRIQRILTKLQMAQDTMSFDEAVQAYIDQIGMEPTNALIEVQRDSQSPASPGREIIGERLIEEMWQRWQKRFGEHARLRDFHEALLRPGTLPLPAIDRLMFRDER